MKKVKFALVLMVLFSLQTLSAKDIVMVQSDKTFLGNIPPEKIEELWENPLIEKEFKVEEVKLKVGDGILFKNRDIVNHNVSGKISDETIFDVTLQEPGEKNDRKITLKKKGEYVVQCAIHPKMKLKVIVED
jgi:hypothetical protein